MALTSGTGEHVASDTRILYCHCAFAQVVPTDVKARVLEGLAASGRSFEAVPDLCEMSARRDPALRRLGTDAPAVVVACYPRAVRWLFSAAGAALPEDRVRIVNMREESADSALAAIDAASAAPAEADLPATEDR